MLQNRKEDMFTNTGSSGWEKRKSPQNSGCRSLQQGACCLFLISFVFSNWILAELDFFVQKRDYCPWAWVMSSCCFIASLVHAMFFEARLWNILKMSLATYMMSVWAPSGFAFLGCLFCLWWGNCSLPCWVFYQQTAYYVLCAYTVSKM